MYCSYTQCHFKSKGVSRQTPRGPERIGQPPPRNAKRARLAAFDEIGNVFSLTYYQMIAQQFRQLNVYCRHLYVTGEKMLNTFCPGRGSNQDLLRGSQTLYRVAIKAGLYSKAVQVYIYLHPVTFSPTKLGFVLEDPGHRECCNNKLGELLHGAIDDFTLGAKCDR